MSINETFVDENNSIRYPYQHIVLLCLELPSICLSLIIFAHFGTSRAVRSINHQQSIFLILMINFFLVIIDIPITIKYYYSGGIVILFTSAFCTWWIWFDYSFYSINAFLMAWISIERYLFIFHKHVLLRNGDWKMKLIRFSPVIFSISWPIFFYTLVIVINPFCTNDYVPDSLYCGSSCYLATILGPIDIFLNITFPVLVCIVGNILLISRVFHQQTKNIARRQINWRNQGKMIIQLFIISVSYILVWVPLSMAQLGQNLIGPDFMAEQYDTINFLMYIFPQILPIICLPLVPQLFKRLKVIWSKRHRTAIMPISMSIGNTFNGKTLVVLHRN